MLFIFSSWGQSIRTFRGTERFRLSKGTAIGTLAKENDKHLNNVHISSFEKHL